MVGTWNIGKVGLTLKETSIVKKSGCKVKGKGRSLVTYQNKLRKIKSYYNKKVKESKKAKEKKRGKKNHVYFFEKYPIFEKYMKVLTIKKGSK